MLMGRGLDEGNFGNLFGDWNTDGLISSRYFLIFVVSEIAFILG